MSSSSSFFIGIAASLVAMIIVFIVARWRWPRILGVISGSPIFGHGVEFCYNSQQAAQKDMVRHFKESNNIRVMCMRAFSVTQPERPFNFLLEDNEKNIKFLLADPGDNLNDNPEINRAATEYGKGTSLENYRGSVQISLRAVKANMNTRSNVQCQVHRLPRFIRAFLCDDYGFICFFRSGIAGADLPIIAVRRTSPFYGAVSRAFDLIWKERSRNIADVKNL